MDGLQTDYRITDEGRIVNDKTGSVIGLNPKNPTLTINYVRYSVRVNGDVVRVSDKKVMCNAAHYKPYKPKKTHINPTPPTFNPMGDTKWM
ncbi:hypothetical protein ACSWYU_004703 [Vibrio harveyi]